MTAGGISLLNSVLILQSLQVACHRRRRQEVEVAGVLVEEVALVEVRVSSLAVEEMVSPLGAEALLLAEVLGEMVSSLGVEALLLVEGLLLVEALLLVEVLEEMAGVAGADGVSNHHSNHRSNHRRNCRYNNNSNNNSYSNLYPFIRTYILWEISLMQRILQSTVITELMAMLLQWSASLIYTGRRQLKITDSTI